MSGFGIVDMVRHLAPQMVEKVDDHWRVRERVPRWPPDAFAVVAAILQRSGAYTTVIHEWPPEWPPEWVVDGEATKWNERIRDVGAEWRKLAAQEAEPPEAVKAWWKTLRDADQSSVDSVRQNRELNNVLLQISAAADEACAGLGIVNRSPGIFELKALPNLLLKDSKTLCSEIDSSRAIVLPKAHTPQTGITIRSITHNLALYLPGEVVPMWWMQGSTINNDEWCLNVLILPWPLQVTPRHFRAASCDLHNLPPPFGFFACDVRRPKSFEVKDVVDAWKAARQHLTAVEGDDGSRIDMIVFPELALRADEPLKIMNDTGAIVIGGVGEDIDENTSRNYAAVAIPPATGVLRQDKHHRWKLDGNQIKNYGLGSRLDPTRNWWENIQIDSRQLKFFALSDWLMFSVLICEDLARLDPVTELLRAVAPNLVVALLLDGPQLSSRWPARYATVLADDPGSSVLTVTSLGMATSSVPAGKDPSRVIALWKDARSAVPEEITLHDDAIGVVLNLRREFVEEWTADGRSDGGGTSYLLRNKIHQIKPPKPK